MGKADTNLARRSVAADEPKQKERQPEPEPQAITHFSHVHTLNKAVLPPSPVREITCNGCWLPCSGVAYVCVTCDFWLHKCCATARQRLDHGAHGGHPLVFSAKPAYPDGTFNCDACGKQGRGFCFRCPTCCFDLHVPCATLPHQVTHPSHGHQLSLIFSIPYPTRAFNCDVCRHPGNSTGWLYHCAACGFDAHLHCATGSSPQPEHANYLNQPPPPPQQHQESRSPSSAATVHQQVITSPLPNPYSNPFAVQAQQRQQLPDPYSNLLAVQAQQLQQLIATLQAQSAMDQRFVSEFLSIYQQPTFYNAMMPGFPGQSGSSIDGLTQQLLNFGNGQGSVGGLTSLLSGNGIGGFDLASLASMFF